MAERALHRFSPDYAIPPGETLRESIDALGISQQELAKRTGRTPKTINEIIQGKAPITAETALQLERVLGVPAHFWINLESNYRADLAALDEKRKLAEAGSWLKQFPWAALVRLGAVRNVRDQAARVRELLGFYRVASPEAWNEVWANPSVAFRRSPAFQSAPGAVSAWLRLGEREAESIECAPYDRAHFRRALDGARKLTAAPPHVFQPRLRDLCAAAGVAVVFTPELPKTHVSGATRWLTSEKALIQLSVRYKSDDHLWFCFFHEAGHVLLHGKRDVFLDDCEGDGEKEAEANRFAADFLIPEDSYATFLAGRDFSDAAITQFAAELGIAPGIVVGRLQHDRLIPFSQGNQLKQRYVWKHEE